jgi:hypothetical protein
MTQNRRKDPPPNKHFHACHRIQNPDGAATILRRQSEVFDVQLHSVSPPRGEAASPPSPRCTKLKKAVTLGALQFTALSCSYTDHPRSIFKRGQLFRGVGGVGSQALGLIWRWVFDGGCLVEVGLKRRRCWVVFGR